ncbi:MAG: hypothetical protein AB4080_02210 [Trichodesmium sp.]
MTVISHQVVSVELNTVVVWRQNNYKLGVFANTNRIEGYFPKQANLI